MKKLMSFINRQTAAMFVLACVLLTTSCSDDEPTDALRVTSISPLTGPKGTVVTIVGTNFSISLMESEVTFNGKPGIITSATPTQLTVVVPPAADSGPVIVNSKGETATNQPAFTFQWSVSTLAGTSEGYENGSVAKFKNPSGIVADAQGNLYVTDFGNDVIRKITPEGLVSTWAGSTQGTVNGAGANAKFWSPNGCTIDNTGNVYVSEEVSCLVRKITNTGVVSTLAGTTYAFDYADGTGTAAMFNYPSGIAIDGQGNLYAADQGNHRIRKVTPEGVVTTLAGSTQGSADGTGGTAQFFRPVGVVVDATGNVYVGDLFNHRIRRITAAGVVTTLAGSSYGSTNGSGTAAQFAYPAGLTLDKQGNVYVADTENHRLRKITPEGVVTTFAGTTQGNTDGLASSAQFFLPREIDIDDEGVMYVADAGNNRIRKID